MGKTFFKNLELEILDNIYEPREDSEILAENMQIKEENEVLDTGSGSGVLSLIASKEASYVLGVDIDERAVKVARSNANVNEIENVEFRKSDLFEEVEGKYDVILFNPPYLPTEEENSIWSGGKNGRQIIERFAKDFKKYLKEDGKVYMVISSLTGEREVKELFKKVGMKTSTIDQKKVPWEKLYVLEIKR